MLEWVHGLPAQRRHDGKPGRLSPRSVHKYAETTRLLFKAAAKRDLIPVSPCVWDASDLPPKEDSDPTRAREGGFSAEQVGWLYNRTGQLWPLMCAAVRCVRVAPAAKPKESPVRVTLLGAAGGERVQWNGYTRGRAKRNYTKIISYIKLFAHGRNGGRARESNPPAAPFSTTHRF